MAKSLKICYIDKVWYNPEKKALLGDMGFSFEDAPTTRRFITNYDELVKETQDYIDSPECDWERNTDTDGFAIYLMVVADATCDEDYTIEDETDLWYCHIDDYDTKELLVTVKESEMTEEAKAAVKEDYENVPIRYRK